MVWTASYFGWSKTPGKSQKEHINTMEQKQQNVSVSRKLSDKVQAVFDRLNIAQEDIESWVEGETSYRVSYLKLQERGKSTSTVALNKRYVYVAILVDAETGELVDVMPQYSPIEMGITRCLLIGKKYWEVIAADVDKDAFDRATILASLQGLYQSQLEVMGADLARQTVKNAVAGFDWLSVPMVIGNEVETKPQTVLRKKGKGSKDAAAKSD